MTKHDGCVPNFCLFWREQILFFWTDKFPMATFKFFRIIYPISLLNAYRFLFKRAEKKIYIHD